MARRIWLGPLCALSALASLHCSAAGDSNSKGNGGSGNNAGNGFGANGGSGGFLSTGGTGAGGGTQGDCEGANQKTSSGCNYYAVVPDITFDARGGCFAAFVVNPSNENIFIKVSYAGQSLDPNQFGYIPSGSGPGIQYTKMSNSRIPAGEIAILFLNRFGASPLGLNTSCPPGVTPAISTMDAAPHGTSIGSAFHFETSAPVVAYDIYPYGGGQSALTSATLLLPTTSWGDNYIGVSAFGNGLPIGSQPFLSVVAHQDGTEVTISPNVAIVGGTGVAATGAGQPRTYSINEGQVLQFTQAQALDGSVIQSNVPVGVWGGMTTLSIGACCAESAHQQIPPIRALGSEYVGVRYRNRYDGIEESPPWRLIGAADGTSLTWEPSTPPGAPTTLNLGQVAQFNAPGPFVVRSQSDAHPFYMSAHMTGAAEFDPAQQEPPTGSDDGRGDAEFVNVVPPGEYLDRYVFFADPTYPETNLIVVRRKTAGEFFADVSIDCAGALDGWQPIGTSGRYEYTYFDLVRYDFQGQKGCNTGRREIVSDEPFGLTVWGWGSGETGSQLSGFYSQYVSYAYPGGASVSPINDVVVPPAPR